jgi:hypothetical protein
MVGHPEVEANSWIASELPALADFHADKTGTLGEAMILASYNSLDVAAQRELLTGQKAQERLVDNPC